jgi:hypothetical protein
MNHLTKILGWIQNHWGALAILGTMFWSFVTAIWVAFALPVIDAHIDSRIMKLADDSLGLMVDAHMTNKGGGFRSGFAEITGVPKENVTDSLAYLYLDEKTKDLKFDSLAFATNYQHGFNHLMIKLICSKQEYNSVPFWVAPTGDAYYEDVHGLIWDANYSNSDDCYYYYPPYNNNKRTRCVALINY